LARSLVHLDPRDPASATRTPLDLILTSAPPDIRALRAYQNRLYLVDHASGLYVFDIFGAYSRRIPLPGLTDLQFSADELFFLSPDGRTLRFEPLFAPATTPRALALPAAPTGTSWTRALPGPANRFYLFSARGIAICTPSP